MRINDEIAPLKRRPKMTKKRIGSKRKKAAKPQAAAWEEAGGLKPGRKPILLTCKLCSTQLNKTEMRLHEPECRRARLIKVGARFTVRANQKLVPVEIMAINPDGSMTCLNLQTARHMKIRSARRFRDWMETANIRHQRSERPASQNIAPGTLRVPDRFGINELRARLQPGTRFQAANGTSVTIIHVASPTEVVVRVQGKLEVTNVRSLASRLVRKDPPPPAGDDAKALDSKEATT